MLGSGKSCRPQLRHVLNCLWCLTLPGLYRLSLRCLHVDHILHHGDVHCLRYLDYGCWRLADDSPPDWSLEHVSWRLVELVSWSLLEGLVVGVVVPRGLKKSLVLEVVPWGQMEVPWSLILDVMVVIHWSKIRVRRLRSPDRCVKVRMDLGVGGRIGQIPLCFQRSDGGLARGSDVTLSRWFGAGRVVGCSPG